MKKQPLFFLLFLTPLFLTGQNLVWNPSFEETGHCITEADVSKYTNVPSLSLSQCRSWASFSGEGTADLFQPCNAWKIYSSSQQVKARTGVAYAGLYAFDRACCESEYREYLVGKLKSSLDKGKNYEISFWVLLSGKSGCATSSLGVHFSKDTLYRLDEFYGVAPFIPQVQNKPGNVYTSKQQWSEIRFTYKAQGGEQYIMIGNFRNDLQTEIVEVHGEEKTARSAYYYIDDVCVSAQNCSVETPLPHYGFRAMVYDARENTPITGALTEIIDPLNPEDRKTQKTENDGKVKFSLPEREYLCMVKADCYLPQMDFYYVPLTRKGDRLPEQLNYFSMTRLEQGAKMIFGTDFYQTIPELSANKKEQLTHLFTRLDKLAEYLKENPSLKVSVNAAINLSSVSTEEKRAASRSKHITNLEFIKNYWLGKGVKTSQFLIRIVELSKDNPSVSGSLEGTYIGKTSSRYELEILETGCKSPERDFFDRKEKGEVYVLDKVFFAPDSPELEKRSFEELDKLVVFLKQHATMRVRINGHTDIGKENGSLEFLQQLSDHRAKAVADYLISKGVNKNNISWQGFANRRPVAGNDTEAGKAQNRRVEVEILEN